MSELIFVFGSNLAGLHGAGAAKHAALRHGAIRYQGEGRQGNSYALPTKDEKIKTLPLHRIRNYADRFKRYARENPDLKFQLTAVGCGYAGYKPEDMYPMFEDAPPNVLFPPEWAHLITNKPMW